MEEQKQTPTYIEMDCLIAIFIFLSWYKTFKEKMVGWKWFYWQPNLPLYGNVKNMTIVKTLNLMTQWF